MELTQRRYDLVALLGRVLLSATFIITGLNIIPNWDQTVNYLVSHGMTWVPLFLYPAIFIQVLGGLFILLGYRARVWAVILVFYVGIITFFLHPFWKLDGIERQIQLINFLKNLSIIGGLLVVAAFGTGILSWDVRRRKKQYPPPELLTRSELKTPSSV
jgi:putative oxidoreductase